MAEHRKRKRRTAAPPPAELDETTLKLTPRTWVLLAIGAIVLAMPGVAIYSLSPGVGTYQLNGLLLLPLLGLAGYGLHKWLPNRLQWVLAATVAPVGTIAYLLVPSAQWWNYGPLTAVPLIALSAWRRETREGRSDTPEPWFGGMSDGPWGPP